MLHKIIFTNITSYLTYHFFSLPLTTDPTPSTNVWQRIQTLWLLLATTSLVIGSFVPFYQVEGRVLGSFFIEDGHGTRGEWVFLGLGYVLSAIVSIVTLCLYKCRKDQLRGCAICLLLIVATFLGGVYYVKMYFGEDDRHYDLGAYALVAAMLFTWLARMFISRDEKLVRSADRLR